MRRAQRSDVRNGRCFGLPTYIPFVKAALSAARGRQRGQNMLCFCIPFLVRPGDMLSMDGAGPFSLPATPPA
jgi:hypothetical protein